jgi:hypothetical protein
METLFYENEKEFKEDEYIYSKLINPKNKKDVIGFIAKIKPMFEHLIKHEINIESNVNNTEFTADSVRDIVGFIYDGKRYVNNYWTESYREFICENFSHFSYRVLKGILDTYIETDFNKFSNTVTDKKSNYFKISDGKYGHTAARKELHIERLNQMCDELLNRGKLEFIYKK